VAFGKRFAGTTKSQSVTHITIITKTTPEQWAQQPRNSTLHFRQRLLAFTLVILANTAQSQDIRYVSDTNTVPLRSGAGNEFRIVHRGIPSGTKLTVARNSADGVWSEITTERGTSGWIRSQYLMAEKPAKLKLDAVSVQGFLVLEFAEQTNTALLESPPQRQNKIRSQPKGYHARVFDRKETCASFDWLIEIRNPPTSQTLVSLRKGKAQRSVPREVLSVSPAVNIVED